MTVDESKLLGSITAFFDHGLLVLEDTSSKAAHDAWDAAAEPVHLDGDSLYLAVSSSVDGPVTVSVYEGRPPAEETAELSVIFTGKLPLKNGLFKVADSDDRARLTLQTVSGLNDVTVYVDEPDWVSRVLISIGH